MFEVRENEFFTEMVDGWGEILDNLAKHLNEALDGLKVIANTDQAEPR